MVFMLMLSIAFSACGGGGSDTTDGGTFIYATDKYNLRYWKNGEMVPLLYTDDNNSLNDRKQGQINDIKVDGSTVYMCGTVDLNSNKAGYWKNDEWVELRSGGTTGIVKATSLNIYNGDVYICGYEEENAVYVWKNSSELISTTGAKYATTMAVSEEGYLVVGGYVELSGSTTASDYINAVNWYYDLQNGGSFTFLQYTENAYSETQNKYVDFSVNSITAVSTGTSTKIYAGGYSGNKTVTSNPVNVAGYWTGELTSGTREWHALSSDAEVLSIVINDNTVYAGGYVTNSSGNKVAGYWEGTEWTALSDGTTDAEAGCIVIDGDDLYVGGYIAISGAMIPGYWLNGEWNELTLESEYSSTFTEGAMVSAIAVVHK